MSASNPNPHENLARFGLTSFRRGQEEVISAVLAGHDCLCIMPTGGGKSLCFQLPAIARGGLTLVVSPLIALMKDQVDSLSSLGIPVTFINSSLPLPEQRLRLENMAAGRYRLVYVAPERLRNPLFQESIRGLSIALLAVDEAHCISEWGHDFRPDYARLGRFRQRLGFPQTIALTATATPDVRRDVAAMLQLRDPKIFVSGFARPNLHFEVRKADDGASKDAALLSFLNETAGSGIIYVSTRKKCGELVTLLSEKQQRKVGLYHAGLLPDDRRRIQDDFMADRLSIIVATNAFGMGIDKPDLRFVVHYNIPGSLEAYYQEAGRAGRDGQPARCLLLYTYQDRYIQEFFIDNAHPSADTVAAVYEYLQSMTVDPIEITLDELKDELDLPVGGEGVGACERLLEKCGAIERVDSLENKASVRIDSDLPTLVDLLPKEAKTRRKVLRKVEELVGDQRYERVYFHAQKLAAMAEVDRDTVLRVLRELSKLQAFDYVPAFRGRAIHMLTPERSFEDLEIDFEELERRRQAEYDKLERVINFAKTRRCRQLEILDYFGDTDSRPCGVCDNCHHGPLPKPALSAAHETAVKAVGPLLDAVRMVLSGVARAHGRFGKKLIAQMLAGSQSAKVSKFGLQRLSTFGLLSHLQLTEVERFMDEVLAAGLLEQYEVDRRRPLVRLTEYGDRVMRNRAELTRELHLPEAIVRKIGGVAQPPAASPASGPPSLPPAASAPAVQRGPPDRPTREVAPTAAAKAATAAHHQPDYYWTWRLLHDGYRPGECEQIRGLRADQVLEHALAALEHQLAVRAEWFLSPSQLQRLHKVVGAGPAGRAKHVLENLQELGADLNEAHVQLYLRCREAASAAIPDEGPMYF